MNKRLHMFLAAVCYMLGIFASIYIGGWVMLVKPIRLLLFSYDAGSLTMGLIVRCVVKIALSTTMGGLVWCIGYIGCNHFKGTEDEYDRIIAQEMQKRRQRMEQKENTCTANE